MTQSYETTRDTWTLAHNITSRVKQPATRPCMYVFIINMNQIQSTTEQLHCVNWSLVVHTRNHPINQWCTTFMIRGLHNIVFNQVTSGQTSAKCLYH